MIRRLLNRSRVRRLGLGLLLVMLPACGLSDYEGRMLQTQEREQRFRDESQLLDAPVKVPTRKEIVKDKDKETEREVSVGNVFFRPPKGIQAAFVSQQHGNLWHYPLKGKGDVLAVEMAFSEGEKEFAADVLRNFQATEHVKATTRQLVVPGRATPLDFDVWEFEDTQYGYSVNTYRSPKLIAVVFFFAKGRRDSVRKVVELSLATLAVDAEANTVRQKYNQKSPWQLKAVPER
jgi:hypothetical protein